MLEDVLNDHKLAMRAKDPEVQLVAAPVVVEVIEKNCVLPSIIWSPMP
jgi:hypothetical protein